MPTETPTEGPSSVKLPSLPGTPMPSHFGTSILKCMDLPNHQGHPARLVIDNHATNLLCFRAGHDEDTERWLLIPTHPSKLERTLRGASPPVSAMGNAEFLMVQDVRKSRPNRVSTNMLSPRNIDDSVLAALPALPDLYPRMQVPQITIWEWKKMLKAAADLTMW